MLKTFIIALLFSGSEVLGFAVALASGAVPPSEEDETTPTVKFAGMADKDLPFKK